MPSQAGYRYLKTYQLAVIITDLTEEFCQKFLKLGGNFRLREQMTSAARSGKQNIVEGYTFKSLKSYIKLLGVSRGSFEELLEDYKDFVRRRKLSLWPKDDPRVRAIRGKYLGNWGYRGNSDIPDLPDFPDNPEQAINLLITFIHQENYLLDRQIAALESKFIKEGGYTEKLFRRRLYYRNN